MSYLPRLHPFTRLAHLVLVGLLASCGSTPPPTASLPSTTSPSPVEPASAEMATATISEIPAQPVWVTLLNATEDIAATEQMGLRVGETVRTQGEASAQINLKNGLALRIGGNSVLTLEPDNRLYLKRGESIAWVKPGRDSPVEIITPDAIAEINGSTVSVRIADSPQAGTELFVWEGTVTLRLPDQSGEVQLQSGETVSIQRGEADISQIRRAVQQLSSPEWLRRRYQSRLLNNFGQSLPTLTRIDRTLPSVESPNPTRDVPARKPAPRPPKTTIASSVTRNTPAQRVEPPSNPTPEETPALQSPNPTPEDTPVLQPESPSAWKPITEPLPELPLNSVPTLQQELSGPIWQPTPKASPEPASSPSEAPEEEPDTAESEASPEKSETSGEPTFSEREIDAPSTTPQASPEASE